MNLSNSPSRGAELVVNSVADTAVESLAEPGHCRRTVLCGTLCSRSAPAPHSPGCCSTRCTSTACSQSGPCNTGAAQPLSSCVPPASPPLMRLCLQQCVALSSSWSRPSWSALSGDLRSHVLLLHRSSTVVVLDDSSPHHAPAFGEQGTIGHIRTGGETSCTCYARFYSRYNQ